MKLILLGIYGLIVCIAILAIYQTRNRHDSNNSVIDEKQNKDFIETFIQKKKQSLTEQPWNMKWETYATIGGVCGVLFTVLGYVTKGVGYAFAGGLFGLLLPELIVRLQSATQKKKFEERYARSLRQLSSGLKSGLSLHQAIDDVCHSPFVHDDVKKEFQQLSAELKLGVSIQEAFNHFAERVGFEDAQDVAIAIGMQTKTGGREGAVVETIAKNIGDRMMLRKEVNSMFAGSNVTVSILDILPFAVVAFMVFGASEFMSIYFESTGMFTLFVGLLIFMGVGSVVTRSMIAKLKRECGVK